MKYAALLLALFATGSCIARHRRLAVLCNKELFVEIFSLSPVGISKDYLTDSVTFRQEIGTCDAEHEEFIYTCKGDSIRVVKLQSGSKNCRLVILPNGLQTVKCDVDTIQEKSYSYTLLKAKGLGRP